MSRKQIREAVREAANMNLLERGIAAVSPRWAAERMRSRMFMAVAGGYTGASKRRRQLAEWKYNKNTSADADELPDLPDLRDRSRDLTRNEPIAAGAIGTMVTNIVGTGLALQSRVDSDVLRLSEEQATELQASIEREYELWAESTACDATRTQDIYGLQALALRAALESGDVFATLPQRAIDGFPYKLCVQLYEADQVSNPQHAIDSDRIAGGVELDANRAPIAYHFQESHPGALQRISTKWFRVDAFGARTGRRQVLHVYKKLRPGQTRGVPYLATVIETLKMLGRYTEAELMAAVIAGMFTVFVTSERGGLEPNDPTGLGGETGAQASDKDVKLGAGAIVDLNPGEKTEFANPGRPNQAFDGFVNSLASFIGVALEIPREVLLKHFTASYSASQAALLEAWKMFKERRSWMATVFLNPLFEAFMDEAVSSGRIAAPGYFVDPLMRRAYLACEWVGDGKISLDQVKDVEAAKARIEAGISTIDKESALYDGSRFQQNHAQRVREHEARVRAGLVAAAPAVAPAAAKPASGDGSTRNDDGSDKEKPEDA